MLPSVVHRPVVGWVDGNQNIQISQKLAMLQKNDDIFEISIKNTFRGPYCNHCLNFAVDQGDWKALPYRTKTFDGDSRSPDPGPVTQYLSFCSKL